LYVPLLWLFNERASHSAGITLLQMQIVINNIINKICSETKKTVKHEVIRVTALTTGSEAWWQSKNGPEWERRKENYRVTFWWRDPAGTQRTSPIKRVWLYVTGVTDHHQNARPQSLERIPGYRRLAVAGRVQPRVARKLLFYPFRE
jgi:enterochelin esterase family protein